MVYTLLHLISGLVVFCHFCAFSILMGENFYLPEVPLPLPTSNPNSHSHSQTGDSSGDIDSDSADSGYPDMDMDAWEKDAPLPGDFHDDILHQDQSANYTGAYFDDLNANGPDDETRENDVIWILLILSLFSIGLHITILMHVRSTAPSNDAMKKSIMGKMDEGKVVYPYNKNGKKKKRLGYWIYNQYRNGRPFHINSLEDDSGSVSSHGDSDLSFGRAVQTPSQMRDRGVDHDHDMDLSVDDSNSLDSGLESGLSASAGSDNAETDAFLSHDVFRNSNTNSLLDRGDDGPGPSRRKNRRRTSSGVFQFGIHRCFSTGYDGEFCACVCVWFGGICTCKYTITITPLLKQYHELSRLLL